MSDTRFIIIGTALIFVGIIILAAFGHDYQAATLESNEFETCYVYSDESEPVETDCSVKIAKQGLFFALVVGFIGTGVILLVKGVKGDWDSKVKAEDMAGPGRRDSSAGN